MTSLLEAHDIPVFVHGRHLGSLLPGLQIGNYNTQSIMVPEECVTDALELLLSSGATIPVQLLRRFDGGIACVSFWKASCSAGLFPVVGTTRELALGRTMTPNNSLDMSREQFARGIRSESLASSRIGRGIPLKSSKP